MSRREIRKPVSVVRKNSLVEETFKKSLDEHFQAIDEIDLTIAEIGKRFGNDDVTEKDRAQFLNIMNKELNK